jgi:uncharacterized protein (DUF1501 family)
MYFLQTENHSRRAFLGQASKLAFTGAALPLAMNLAAMGEAAAFDATDYKALVCVFLYGGNDYANTCVTYDDASYNKYASIRMPGAGTSAGSIVIPKAALTPNLLVPRTALANGRQYALHPSMSGLASLFNSGQAAVQLNMGPLIAPMTRAQYFAGTVPKPAKLFSHNDQQSTFQSLGAEGSTVGWGGTLGDLSLSGNSGSLFTCISVAGNAVFLSGRNAAQYQCSTSGAVAIQATKDNTFYQPAMRAAYTQFIQQPRTHILENEYNKIVRRSIAAESQVSIAIGGVSLSTVFPTGSKLGDQLKMVAQLIGARAMLGVKRQVFLVALDGFDLHDNLVAKQPSLLGQVSESMSAFYKATAELGIANKVTAFTASDFGRTLTSNGDGSDHGWGSHHVVVGGAVKGAAFYGTVPPVSASDTASPDDQWHVGQGRLLPSTSVDQFSATLATWFGVAETEINSIFPNLRNFGTAGGRPDYPSNLGFML